MKRYYIVENEQQLGPFSIEDLKSMRLEKSTLVRAENGQDWDKADKIDELKSILFPEPASPSKITELPSPQSRRSKSISSSSSSQSSEKLQSTPMPDRRPRSVSSTAQSHEPSPLSIAASSAASSNRSSTISTSKKIKSVKLKTSILKYIIAGIGSAAVVVLIVVFGLKYLEIPTSADIGLIPVKSGNLWGYIDSKGKYIINPQFEDADYFFDGLARVVSSDGKVGYIGENGKYVISAEFKNGTTFSDGFAFVVSTGGHPTCIDKSGNIKFSIEQAKQISEFREGLARFGTADGKYGYIDDSGMEVIKPQFDFAGDFNEGMTTVKLNTKWGYIDKTGYLVINPQFANTSAFCEGKAFFNNGNKYGYIDKKGNYLINPQFDEAYSFSEGMASIKSGNKYGYINANGDISINQQFDEVMPFRNGLAAIKQNGSWGFIDKKGNIVISPQYEAVSVFFNGIAFVKSENTWGIVDKTGKYLANPQFEYIKQRTDFSFNFEPTFVISDYYDTSSFINIFFERVKDGSFDGFGASFTLQTLLDNKTYCDDVNTINEYQVIYEIPQRITNDIYISNVTFSFDNPVYSYSDYGKKYNFDEKIVYIKYSINIKGEAASRLNVIIEALKTEIEKQYKIEMKKNGGFHGYHDSYSGFDEKTSTDFSICIGSEIDFYVGFNQGILTRFWDN